MNKYTIIEKILSSANSTIFLANDVHDVHHTHNKQVVVKRCNIKQSQREKDLTSMLQHPNIIICYDIIEEPQYIYLILEHAPKGDILKMDITETQLKHIIYQLAQAICYCHENNIIHRDIKPENVVMTGSDTIKLIDFGWSCIYDENNPINEQAGTTIYNSPEMILEKTHTFKIDSWQIGVLIFEMTAHRLPFDSHNLAGIKKKIVKSKLKYPTYFSQNIIVLLRKTFQKKPKNRICSSEIINEKWFQ